MEPASSAVETTVPPGRSAPATRLPVGVWLREGLRAGAFLRPRIDGAQPTPIQLALLVALLSALEIALAWLEVTGPAEFDLRGWLAPWWSTAALILLVWALLPPAGTARPCGVAAWLALWLGAVLPANAVSLAVGIAQAHGVAPRLLDQSVVAGWTLYLALWAWIVAVALRLGAHFGLGPARLGGLALGLAVIFSLTAWQFPDRPWRPDLARSQEASPAMQLSQEVFEAQQALWDQTVSQLAPERPGVTDVYAVVFAPFADEDVFLRESSMVSGLLAARFDAVGRVIHLVNHASTADSHSWATPLNLARAIQALSRRMDREHDVLVVYLTSHGASDYKLAAAHGPLALQPVSPGELRESLDKAGIRHRVIAVSACYSGGWVGPLADANTLVMTAADATHTSYGCGRLSELTFFGRAVFDEQLRQTRSFEQAFARAIPVIRQREAEAGKDDGFSNPQIAVGGNIRPVLQELERRLEGR